MPLHADREALNRILSNYNGDPEQVRNIVRAIRDACPALVTGAFGTALANYELAAMALQQAVSELKLDD